MRRFLLGLITVLLTLAIVIGAAYALAKLEKKAQREESPMVTETTQAAAPTVKTQPTQMPETLSTETFLPEKTVYDAVPSYFQTDYPHVKFGNGTMATSGCSVTCLAMVATYLTDHEYMPDQLAYHFGRYGKNNIERLEYGNAQMQLPCVRSENVQEVLQALRQGKVAIVMVDSESIFTTEQHFIVAAMPDGKLRINDPYEPNYTATVYMKNAHENGFEEHDLMRGFSGAWIYDKQALPEEPFLFDAALPEQEENRYPGYTFTDVDKYILASFVWAEGRDQSVEAQQAMVEVVLNRVISADFPNTVRDVIYQTELYRAVSAMERLDERELKLENYLAVEAAVYGPYILPTDIYYYSQWEKGREVWGQLGDYTFSRYRQ